MEKPDGDKIPSGVDNQNDSQSDSDSNETDSSDSSSDEEYVCTVCDKTFSGYLPLKQHKKGSKHKKALSRKKKIKKIMSKGSDDDDDDHELFLQEHFADCKFCNKQFSGPESYTLHLKSKAHKQKKLEASILEQVKENGEINVDKLKELYIKEKSALGKDSEKAKASAAEGYDDLDTGDYECKSCDKVFSGLVPFTQHLVSKTHAKQIEKKNLRQKVVPEPSDKISGINEVTVLGVEDDILVCKACSTSFSGPESAVMHLKSKNHKKKLAKYLRKLEKKKNKSTESNELTQSDPKKDEDVVQEEELEDTSSEESDEPTSTLSGEPRSEEKLSEVKTHEMDKNFDAYKKALKLLKKEEHSE